MIYLISQFFFVSIFSQAIRIPLEQNNYEKVTSYDQLTEFVKHLDEKSTVLNVEIIGQSVQGRNLYALKFSSSAFGKDKSKIKVLFFAQQHGNEQSGKEGALILALELLKPENSYLFDKIDFALIPQMNPDGSELNKRRNANETDLNRNHLILTEPEVMALHRFFERYMFEVNLDVHEYYPFGETWEKFGYRKNADVTIGVATNNNISSKIRDLSNNEIVPFWLKYLADKGFSSFIYCPGGPPGLDYFRHSTFDINDGRQSFGILNTFCFIQEGLNGKDSYIENIKQRANGQMNGMYALIVYIYNRAKEMKKIVASERNLHKKLNEAEYVSIQAQHVKDGRKLHIPMFSYYSGKDSLFEVEDYRPVVKSISDVEVPEGYLLPKSDPELIEWSKKYNLFSTEFKPGKKLKIKQYRVESIDSIDFEGDRAANPKLSEKDATGSINYSEYIFIPTRQLKKKAIVLALEPRSMLGLATYKQFSSLLKQGEIFPVLKVLK